MITRLDTTPTRHSPNAVLMLGQRLRRWPNIEPTLEKCTMFERNPPAQQTQNIWVENANRLIKQVKLCLINTYKVDWSIKARNSIKLRTYIKFKFEHSPEEYLFYIPDTRWMKALSRLRMSSPMLEIERGRHVKPQKLPL